VLIDLARHHFGPEGPGRRHESPAPGTGPADEPADTANDGKRLAAWTAFHEQMDLLPAQEREVFELHWYQGLTHGDAAEVLGVSLDTIKRRWQSARLLLYQALDGELPQT
jgi:RNA polymerase sigma-70 factor (ECF subfamily)